MDESSALLVQVISAAAVAIATIVAVIVGIWATIVARRASRAADRQAAAADAAIASSRRQTLLASVPYLAVGPPTMDWSEARQRLEIVVVNGGQTVAYGVIAWAMGAPERGASDPATRKASGRQAALAPGKSLPLHVPAGHLRAGDTDRFAPEWLVIGVEHFSPLGVRVETTYEWATAPHVRKWRARMVEIDPGDGGEPMRFALSLGLSDPD